jgi:hypothetical protein
MLTNRLVIIAFLGSVFLVSCSDSKNNIVKEAVLSPGQTVEATNRFGTVRISYVSPIKRKYEWDGKSRIVKMIARDEPFQGKLGLYEPADSWVFFSTKTRLVVEEAVRHFDTEEQIKTALIEGSAVMDWVYTSDGLVVGFGRTPTRRQINIDLFQFLLRGQKPSGLAGARPNQIRLIETK